MAQYHGWIALRSTAADVEDEPPLRLEEIRTLVDALAGYALMDLRPLNGRYFIHCGGNPNHGGHAERVIELFRQVGRLAPGSYGLLHVWDDEDKHHPDGFRVFRLVRGQVSEHADALLSPVTPTLGDDY